MIGTKVNKLTATSEPFKKPGSYTYYVDCVCECGNTSRPRKDVFLRGEVMSCGCHQRAVASKLKVDFSVGKVYNNLTLVEDLGVISGRRLVVAICACGNTTTARLEAITAGHTKSCGCLQPEAVIQNQTKHGMCRTPTYYAWQGFKDRCNNGGNKHYNNYGGRGITYDPRWEDFENFLEDMGECPDTLSLDRIDVNGNYCKDNCRWADRTIQSHNRRKMDGTSSKYVGVSYKQRDGMWDVRLGKHGVVVYRGLFADEEAAARAYDDVCEEHYGVRKNFPDKE